ncbi:MAG: ester cyclase [Solirubrobacteraceae bacterium]
MSEHNRAVLARLNDEVWRQGNVDVIDELMTEDFVDHTPPPGVTGDREGLKQFLSGVHAGLADPQRTVEEHIEAGDRVVERWTLTAKHAGDWLGVPATGAQISVTGIDVYRFEDGRVADLRCEVDMLGLLGQLGAIPAGEPVGDPS